MMLIRDWKMKENTQICECNIIVGSSDHKLIVLMVHQNLHRFSGTEKKCLSVNFTMFQHQPPFTDSVADVNRTLYQT